MPFYSPAQFERTQAAVRALKIRILKKLHINLTQSHGKQRAVYVSRGKSGSRSIYDASNLMVACRERGLECSECCDWSRMDLNQTIFTFANAHVVFGPHGAGLAHFLYARPNGSMVELGPRKEWREAFTALAASNENGERIEIDIGKEPWKSVNISVAQKEFALCARNLDGNHS